MKNRKLLFNFLAFLIPMIIMVMYTVINKMSFTDFYISDLKEQYLYLFDYYKDFLNGENSIFYSFSNGLGGSMFGTYFYYLSSPLNFLLFLFPSKYIHVAIVILIFIKIGLCGLTMNIYLNKSNKNSIIINLAFSLCYALMSYNIIYYFNVMWLDVVYLTPLVILGLDEILENKKSKKYIIFLFISIFSNWYISYMLCIFIVIYFIFRLFTKYKWTYDKKKIVQIIKKFLVSSTLTGLLCSFFLIPVIFELFNKSNGNSIFSIDFLSNLANFIKNLGISTKYNGTQYDYMSFYCGIFPLIVIINYFINKQNTKDKKQIAMVYLFLIFSIFIPNFSYVWHGFSFPTGLNHRWTFLFSFFTLIIASEKFSYISANDNNRKIYLTVFYLLILLLGNFIAFYFDGEKFEIMLVIINIFFFYSYMTIIDINMKYNAGIYKLSIFVLCLLEIVIFYKCNFITNISLKDNEKNLNDGYIYYRSEFIDSLSELSSDYYRMGSNIVLAVDEKINSNIGGVNNFLSTRNGKFYDTLSKFGYSVYANESYDNQYNCFMNSILGIKYWYGNSKSFCYKLIDYANIEDIKYNLYENDNSKSVGYIITNNHIIYENNIFENQNKFASLFSKYKLYNEIEIDDDYVVLGDYDEIYIYILPSVISNVSIKINDEEVYSYERNWKFGDFKNLGVIKIGNEYKNQRVKFEVIINNKKDSVFFVASLDKTNYMKVLNEIAEQIENVQVEKNRLYGNIGAKKSGTLMMTIPYEKGWYIFVDGKKVKYYSVASAFIGIDLVGGNHKIEMYYIPYGLKLGIIITFISFITTMIYVNKK